MIILKNKKNIIKIIFIALLTVFLIQDLIIQFLPKAYYIYLDKKMDRVITIIKDKDYNLTVNYYICEGTYNNLDKLKSDKSYYLLNKDKVAYDVDIIEFYYSKKEGEIIITNMPVLNYNFKNKKLHIFNVKDDKPVWSDKDTEGHIYMFSLKKRTKLYEDNI